MFEDYLLKSPTLLRDLPLLSGRLLVCRCRPGEACHGDAIFKLSRNQQAPSFQIRTLDGFRAVQLLDLAMGVLAAAGIKPELGISIGEDRKLVVLDGRAPHQLKALNDTLRPPLANLEFGVHWTSLQVSEGGLLQIGIRMRWWAGWPRRFSGTLRAASWNWTALVRSR